MTLFRFFNSGSPAQVRELTAAVQRAASAFDPSAPPLLIAADQEGGQLDALGGATPFPGNMALGAAGDEGLAERVGRATGLELLAMGANVSYAPVCDLADNPANPHIGIRSFGSEPADVARLAAAIVRGLRGSGIAAGGKHFPGLGGSDLDTHHELAVVAHDRARLDRAELVPFRAAIEAGAEVVMSAHLALPAVTGDASLPATLSRAVMHDLIRDDLGFRGLTITDALNMGALPQGDAQVIDVDRGHPRGRRPAADDGRSRGPGAGSRAGCATPRRAGCSMPTTCARPPSGSTGSGGGWARSSSRRSRSSAPPPTRRWRGRSRSARSRWSATTPGCCRSACPPTRASSSCSPRRAT